MQMKRSEREGLERNSCTGRSPDAAKSWLEETAEQCLFNSWIDKRESDAGEHDDRDRKTVQSIGGFVQVSPTRGDECNERKGGERYRTHRDDNGDSISISDAEPRTNSECGFSPCHACVDGEGHSWWDGPHPTPGHAHCDRHGS